MTPRTPSSAVTSALRGKESRVCDSTWIAGVSVRGEPHRTWTPQAVTSREEPLTTSKG